jgi:hypothetical protein
MARPPTAQLLAEKWGQKNPQTSGLGHLSDPIFLTNPAWAARFRFRSLFFGQWPGPRRVAAGARARPRRPIEN